MIPNCLRLRVIGAAVIGTSLCIFAAPLLQPRPSFLRAQTEKIVWTDQEKPIANQISHLRDLPDNVRARSTRQLAIQIRRLPAAPHRLSLANSLANLSTEGDFGRDTLQEVTTTLAIALRETPVPKSFVGVGQPAAGWDRPAMQYIELAQLVRYEHMQASLDDPQFAAAMSKLAADDERRQQVDFTLEDLSGTKWTLKDLSGKVVVVNFWATWCPPCRKEMPDLETLYKRFQNQGLVILAISDEDAGKVKPFVVQQKVSYPILLDPGRKVNQLFEVEGIPKSFVYDRSGKLVAQSIDMRTQKQFLEMLGRAGLQ
jgi:peroxiredoxin